MLVRATGSEDVLLSGTGIAGGFGLGAAVGVLSISNQTTASIGNQARVLAGGDVGVIASDVSDVDLIAGALAAGGAGKGSAVAVNNIDKVTKASIDSGAIVDAAGAVLALAIS